MFGWFRTHKRPDASEAARVLASARVQQDRTRVRTMAVLPDIDWNA